MQDKIETFAKAVESAALPHYYEVYANSDANSGAINLPKPLPRPVGSRNPAHWAYESKFSSWSLMSA